MNKLIRVVVTTFALLLSECSESIDVMFVRQCFRKKDGKRHAYWALVESYRTAAGPRQRVVAWLGKLDEAGWLGVEQAFRQTESSNDSPAVSAQLSLFDQVDNHAPVEPQWAS